MYYVYILQSINRPEKVYRGYSKNLSVRLQEHNFGSCRYTAKYRPWKIIFYAVFTEKIKALKFEKYLKSSSGIAFARKRLV